MKRHLLSLLTIVITIFTTTEAQIPTNGLIAWYPFSGNAKDSSGNGNNATPNNTILTTDRFGRANKAYSFNGINDVIVAPNSSSLNFANGDYQINIKTALSNYKGKLLISK